MCMYLFFVFFSEFRGVLVDMFLPLAKFHWKSVSYKIIFARVFIEFTSDLLSILLLSRLIKFIYGENIRVLSYV